MRRKTAQALDLRARIVLAHVPSKVGTRPSLAAISGSGVAKNFVAKVRDVVGLYVSPPEHAHRSVCG